MQLILVSSRPSLRVAVVTDLPVVGTGIQAACLRYLMQKMSIIDLCDQGGPKSHRKDQKLTHR